MSEPTFRTALIQGANRGLGLELARQLQSMGTRVFGTCRQPESAGALRQVTADVLRLDLEDEATIRLVTRNRDSWQNPTGPRRFLVVAP